MKNNGNYNKSRLVLILLMISLTSCEISKEKSESTIALLSPKLSVLIPNTGSIGDLVKMYGGKFGKVKENITIQYEVRTPEVIDFSETMISFKVPDLIGENFVSVSVDKTTPNSLRFISYDNKSDKDEDYAIEDKKRINLLLSNKESANWVFTGNSITQGAKHTHGMRSFSEIFAERIRWELQRTTDYIINTGISGNTTISILKDFDARINQFNPKVVVLMIGTNDAAKDRNVSVVQFETNLIKIIQKIREVEAVPILLSPNLIIVEQSPERNRLFEYVSKMKKVAQQENVILVDNWNIWSSDLQRKYKGEVYKYLLNDPLHPNGFGHQEIAIALFKALSIFESTASTCGGGYYEGSH